MIATTAESDSAQVSTPIEVRLARTAEERESIARLRYDVYVREMGRPQPCADHRKWTIHERMDEDAFLYGAFLPDGRAVGTLRISPSTSPAIPFRDLYGWERRQQEFPEHVVLASKLMVAPSRRGRLVVVELVRKSYRDALARGDRACFLDANDHLLGLYARIGFRPLARREHPLYGDVTVMEWDLLDAAHLRACRSPVLRDLEEFQGSSSRAA